jgi:urease accessory protein
LTGDAPPILMITRRAAKTRAADESMVLPFDMRSRSRFRTCLRNGEEVGVVLERGQILRGGDLLLAGDGRVIEVIAAVEWVTTVRAEDARLLARAAYHLGNRHVALQINDAWLRYSHDHVLDDMVRGLNAQVIVEQAPFEPEAGAYHGAAGSHSHDHGGDRTGGEDHAHGGVHAHGDVHAHGGDHTHGEDHAGGHRHPHRHAK